ncbi:MAG TPA: TonB family protein [Thermodesulfobacteriota bacterium]|nr:TonB family protein [Thermodesulfobacteriota bacterium]
MSIKIADRFSAFLILSLAVHITATFLFIYIQTHAAALVSRDDRKEPIFVDVVDLPPWFKGLKTPPVKPSRISDRNMVAKKEIIPKGAPSRGSGAKVVSSSPVARKTAGAKKAGVAEVAGEKGKKSGKEKVLVAKAGKEKENGKKKTISETPPKTVGEAIEPILVEKSEEERKGDSTSGNKQVKTPGLFPSGERLRELSKVYEAESPKGETGKTLSINTTESKYQKYLLNMKRRIELFWNYPESSIRHGEQGKMRIDFSIAKDGSVKDVRVVKSSNYPALDDAAITAVKLASPFNPFPDNFTIETVEIHASFEYSLIF